MSLPNLVSRDEVHDVPYQPGDIVPWRFVPGIVVASFFASLIGTFLCVEVLHRKRLGKNLISRIQLLSCALAMGLIGIWCMHFIGNRSIVLGNGANDLQMIYSPGWTVLSLILPVVGLSFAFYIAELRIKSTVIRRFFDVLTGFIAGMSIVGMHYCGNLGTTNYHLIYPARFIIAASIIAVVDCIVALMLFFYFKERWISVWWKRFLCAVLLSVAVCGMHYTASVGATYRLKQVITVTSSSRNTPVIVAGVLCAAAALAQLVILFYTSRRNKVLASKAQQVMLACSYFDDEGNIMVTNEGLLPHQKIAKRFNLRNFDEEFNTSHPVFHWLWRVSNDWGAVSDMITKMRSHLRRTDPEARPNTAVSVSSGSFDEESMTIDDQTLLFREGFCIAAADLADHLHIKLEQLGGLYDRITGTGSLNSSSKKFVHSDNNSMASSVFLEKGQLLFFVRRLSKQDTEQFISSGYRFAPPNRVEATIGRMMQIPHTSVAALIKNLQDFAAEMAIPSQPKQGTYLTCFAALGRLSRHFDILVSRNDQGQLPDIQLAPQHLNSVQLAFLRQYDGWTAGRMVADLKQKRSREQHVKADERGFVLLLINSLSSLAHQISEVWFHDLLFNARPITAVYGNAPGSSPTMILGLTKLLDIHQGMVKQPDRLTFIPLDFFRVRTAFYPGCPQQSKFRSAVYSEFAPVLNKQPRDDAEKPQSVTKATGPKRNRFLRHMSIHTNLSDHDSHFPFEDDESMKPDNISERNLVGGRHSDENNFETAPAKGMWGGILATTDTVIVESRATNTDSAGMELKALSQPRVTATAVPDREEEDGKTYADLLYSQAKSRGTSRVNERMMNPSYVTANKEMMT